MLLENVKLISIVQILIQHQFHNYSWYPFTASINRVHKPIWFCVLYLLFELINTLVNQNERLIPCH